MKHLKIVLIITTIITGILLVYFWLTREDWETRERCASCEALENQQQKRYIGTVEISPNGKTILTDQMSGLTYKLIACDANCETKELLPFSKIGVKDYATNNQIYFDIRGKYKPENDEVVYNSIIVLNERKFVNAKKIKGLIYSEINENHTAVQEENFLLNETHYAGLREFIPHYFTEIQLKQPISVKEATWETSETTLITIWFIEKQKQWQPIELYEWEKGTEF